MLGHDAPPTTLWKENLVTGVPLQRCPVRDQLEAPPALVREMREAVDVLWPAYKRGHLLTAGGVADQPARYVAWMTAIERTEPAVEAKFRALTAEAQT